MDSISYETAGVDIDAADSLKKQIGGAVSSRQTAHCTPLNRVGAFASLVELGLSDYKNPVFVLKSEEPGSKQLLSIANNRVEWIARDLIHHLINDIIVMGALPCAVLDTIICGKLENETVLRLIKEMSKACEENGCILVGGETSEQPGVLPPGRYILQASILGIVDKEKIIDGAAIKCGDALLALASNGLHTNGYSLVRKLLETKPAILDEKINGRSLMDAILEPHMSYANAIVELTGKYFDNLHGMAHITGGGMRDNLLRILRDESLQAVIDLSSVRIPRIFSVINAYANAGDADMLRTFNNGIGMILAVDGEKVSEIEHFMRTRRTEAYKIGYIAGGPRSVEFVGSLNWDKI